MEFSSSDILNFKEYVFNDTGSSARHFGLVILPPDLIEFDESIYCAVITSKTQRNSTMVCALNHEEYDCFNKPTYAVLRSLDFTPLWGLDEAKEQPVGRLSLDDARKVYRQIQKAMYVSNSKIDKHLRGAIVREWKRVLGR